MRLVRFEDDFPTFVVLVAAWSLHQDLIHVGNPTDCDADHVEGEHRVRPVAVRVEAFLEAAQIGFPLR